MWSLHIEPAAWVVLALAAAGYRAGLRRASARNLGWDPWRTRAFVGFFITVLVATTSPLLANAAAAPVQAAVAQVLLLLLAPLLLGWSAPLALAVEVGSRGTQRRTWAAIRSPLARLLTHPVVAWCLMAFGVGVLYLTNLFTFANHHEWAAQLVQVLLLVVGCLFFWPVYAPDPLPRRLDRLPAVGYALAMLPYFTVLGFAMESGAASKVAATQGSSTAASQLGGSIEGAGGVIWTVGSLSGIALAVLALVIWLRKEERAVPGRDTGLDPAAHAQLTAWRAHREEALARDDAHRAEIALRIAARKADRAARSSAPS